MSEAWMRDTGLVLAAFFSLLELRAPQPTYAALTLTLLLLALFQPKLLFPIAYLWKKLAEILGAIMPKLFFGIVFLVFVVPVGAIRKAMKKDPLKLKHTTGSVFLERQHTFTKDDVLHPY